jgi:hypothetical protein
MNEVKYLLDCVKGSCTFNEGIVKNLDLLELYNILNQRVIDAKDCLDYCDGEIVAYRDQCKEYKEQIREFKEVYDSGDTAKFEELLDEIFEMGE